MAKTTVRVDLLQALEIVTELGVEAVGNDLRESAIDDVLLPIEEPGGDLVGERVGNDGDDLLNLLLGELTGALLVIDVSLVEDEGGETTPDSANGSESDNNALTTLNVGVEDTPHVLELTFFQN